MWAAVRECEDKIAALGAECERLQALVHVPGQWHCVKCNFTFQQRTLYARTGEVGVKDIPGEKCPNCGTALWRVSWKQEAEELEKRCIEQINERRAVEAKSETAVHDFVQHVVEASDAVGFQTGESGMELVGQMILVLAANP